MLTHVRIPVKLPKSKIQCIQDDDYDSNDNSHEIWETERLWVTSRTSPTGLQGSWLLKRRSNKVPIEFHRILPLSDSSQRTKVPVSSRVIPQRDASVYQRSFLSRLMWHSLPQASGGLRQRSKGLKIVESFGAKNSVQTAKRMSE